MTAQGTTEPKYLQSFHRLHLWQANGCRWHPLRAPSSAGQDRTPWTTQSSIWAQADFCRTVCRLCQRHAFRPPFTGVFGKQDRCLGKQAYNHDKSGLHVDVVLQTEEPRKQETAHQSARHRQQNREGYEHALIQGAQNQIDQNHAEQEYKRGIVGRLAFLTRNAAKLVCVI